MGYERVKKRMEDEFGDLPQWISDLDGGFYKKMRPSNMQHLFLTS